MTPNSENDYDVTYFSHSDSTTWPKSWGSDCENPEAAMVDGETKGSTVMNAKMKVNTDASFRPVKVHAYDGSPVTGDCDLWGIFPRLRSINKIVSRIEDDRNCGLPISFPGLNTDNLASADVVVSLCSLLVATKTSPSRSHPYNFLQVFTSVQVFTNPKKRVSANVIYRQSRYFIKNPIAH